MKKPIYQILHKQMVEHLKDEWVYDSKGIGFFSSITVAERVIERYRKIAGFCDCPKGFVVNKYMWIFTERNGAILSLFSNILMRMRADTTS